MTGPEESLAEPTLPGSEGPVDDPVSPLAEEPVTDPEPPRPQEPDSGPLLTWPVALLAGAALIAGFALGRQILTPAGGPPPLATAVVSADSVPVAPADDTAGLSVGLDWGEQATLGRPAPLFSLPAPDGETVSLADHAGRPVVLNFFATWCGPCRVEMPLLQSASERYRADGLVVLGVDVQETPETVAPFLTELGLTFPVGVDQDGKVSDLYRIGILPTTYFIDREGTVIRSREGFISSEEDLRSELAYILPAATDATPSP